MVNDTLNRSAASTKAAIMLRLFIRDAQAEVRSTSPGVAVAAQSVSSIFMQ